MARLVAQLHFRHHRRAQRSRVFASRRVFDGARQHFRLADAAPFSIFVDAADVSLQRLVLPLDFGRARRRFGLLAQAGGAKRGRRAGRGRRGGRANHASLRRADCFGDADRSRARARESRAADSFYGRRRAAASGRIARRARRRHSRDSCLRLDRDLRPGRRLRMAARMGRFAARRASRKKRPPRPALRRPRIARRLRSARARAAAARRRDDRRGDDARQTA